MNTYIYVHVSLILFDIEIDYSMSVKKLLSFYLRVCGIYNILSIIRYKLDKLLIHAGILPVIKTQQTDAVLRTPRRSLDVVPGVTLH